MCQGLVWAQSEEIPLSKEHEEMIGKPVPDLELNDMDWNEFKLSDLDSTVVLIDFWASWCKSCRLYLSLIHI